MRAILRFLFLLNLVAILFNSPVFGQATFTSNGNGAWNVAGTWTESGTNDVDNIPDSDDIVIIDGSDVVTVPNGVTGTALSVTVGGTACSLVVGNGVAGASVLTISGNITINTGGSVLVGGTSNTAGRTATVNAVNITLNGSGTLTIGNTSDEVSTVSISGLTLNGTSAVTVGSNADASHVLTCSGAVSIGSTANLRAGGNNGGTHTVNFQSTLDNSGTITFDDDDGNNDNDQITMTVTSTSANSGTIIFGTNTGVKTFIGTLTNTGTFDATGLTTTGNLVFRSGVSSNAGTFTAGGATFNDATSNAQTIGGTAAMSFANVVTLTDGGGAALVVTNSNTNTVTLSNTGAATLTGTVGASWTQGSNSTLSYFGSTLLNITLTATTNPNTVIYSAGAQTARVTTYYNLTLSGTGVKTFATTPTVNGILSMEGTTASVTVTTGVVTFGPNATLQYNKTAAYTPTSEEWITPFAASGGIIIANTGTITTFAALTLNVGVPLTINSGATLATGANNAFTLTVGGATTVTGTLTLANTGTKTFTGDVTLNSGAVWNETGIAAINFGGSLTNNATTFTANTGTHTFTGTTKILSGSTTTSMANAAFTGTYTNDGTFTASTTLSGAGGLTQGATGVLNIGGTSTITTLTAAAVGNTINYTGAAGQNIHQNSYYNLNLSGSGNKVFPAALTISGNLAISGAVANLGTGLTHTANTLTLGGTGQAAGSYGSTASAATNQNDTYFLSTSNGIVNVVSCSTGVWLGSTSTDWNIAGNWCDNVIPNASTNVVIPPGGNQPVIGAAGGLSDDITINTGATLTVTGSNSLTVSGSWTNNGTLTANTSTVTFNGTTTLGGTSTTTFSNVLLTGGTVTTSNNLDVNISNNLTIGAGSSFSFSGTNGNLTVGGATQVSGTFTDAAATGVDTFTGLVTVNTGGSFTTTAVTATGNVIFQGGISNSGTFALGGATFNTNNQTLSTGVGSSIDYDNVVTVTGITVTNNGTVNTATFLAADLLTGTGTWTQGATTSSILNYGGGSMSITIFNASATGNTVNYNGLTFAQTIRGGITYYNITLSGALIKTAGASFSVKGNWTKSSLFAPFDGATNNTTITFDGTVAQNINSLGGAATTFYNLTFNNTSASSPQVTLNTNGVTVTNVLTMTDGNVNLNTETLTIGSSAASNGTLSHAESSANGWLYGGTVSRYISTTNLPIGNLRGFFPIGSSTDYRPFYLGYTGVTTGGLISLSHTGASSVTTVAIVDPGPPTIVRRQDSFWDITSAGATAGGAFSLRIGGSGLGTIGTVTGTTTNLRLLTGAAAVGSHAASGGSTTDPRVNRTGLTLANLTGNNFYVASIDATDSPLPIELAYFKGIIAEDAVRLFWETASELNNDFFTVERLNEGDVFDQIAVVKGGGTVNEIRSYQAFDYAPTEGRNYYRLKQTDFDGKVSYSNMVMVDFKDKGEIVNVYPNPTAQETITIELKQLKPGQQVPLQIRSMIGVQAFSNTFNADSTGNIKVRIQVDQWPHGLYLVQIGTDTPVQRKIVIE